MKTSVFLLGLLFATGTALGQEQMTPARFREIAAAPGDSTPLRPQLAAAGPLWTNAMVSVVLTYQSGKVFKEEMTQTAKTIGGKYIVYTVQSNFYHQPMTSIATYDDEASALKTYGLFGETIAEGTLVYDSPKRIYAESSAYGDGFKETTVGSYSDTEDSAKSLVYQNGILVMTREAKRHPVKPQ